jgi:DNA-binding LacI/PurR family transcriptional regulator/DNA-binding transcriptional regulator YhcF (GntR family)
MKICMATDHLVDDAPLYLVVKRSVRARIGVDWRVGERLPTVSDLAREMGVGHNSTHRAVRDLVAEGILLSRRKLGTFVRRLPTTTHDTPQEAGDLKGITIGLVHNGANPEPFIQRMMDGFRMGIQGTGAQTEQVEMDPRQVTLPQTKGMWGLVVFNPNGMLVAPPGKTNLTVVSTSDNIHYSMLSRFDIVGLDQYQGGSLAGLVLKEAGCKSVCFIGRQLKSGNKRLDVTSATRLHGFEMSWGEQLMPNQLIYVLGYSVHSGGLRVADYLAMDPRPQGIFAANDQLAQGFLVGASAHGLVAGKDFHLVGFDGQDLGEPLPHVPHLTTVRVPCEQMGRRAAELLIRRFRDPARTRRRVLMSCSLIRGNTVG